MLNDYQYFCRFAQRAKAVKNKPKINEILTDATMNKRYAELNANLLDRLQHQLNINENLKVSYVNSYINYNLGIVLSAHIVKYFIIF